MGSGGALQRIDPHNAGGESGGCAFGGRLARISTQRAGAGAVHSARGHAEADRAIGTDRRCKPGGSFCPTGERSRLGSRKRRMEAFKALAKNPVGGLRTAFEALGPTRAMQVGIVFAILFDMTFIFAGHSAVAMVHYGAAESSWFVTTIKLLVIGLIPFGTAVGGFAAVRAICKGEGNIDSDIFVAGASVLPPLVLILAYRILGALNMDVILVIGVFAITTTVLILYRGCTTLQRVPEAAATLAVPLMILADLYISKIVAVI